MTAENSNKREQLHTLESGAWLPIFQSLGFGLLIFFSVLILAFIFRFREPLKWGAGSGALAMILIAVALLRHWFSLTSLQRREISTGRDLDHDGYIGQPPAEPKKCITLQIVNPEHTHWKTFDLPCSEEQLRALAHGLLNNTTLSERNWTGAGRPFSIQEFIELRSEMLRRGLIEQASDKDPRQGFNLTATGKQLIELYGSPTLD